MKKLFSLSTASLRLFALCFLLCAFGVYAYVQSDIDNAQFLIDKNIITKLENATLDDAVTRLESIKIALKIKWIQIPDTYVCRGYFSDARTKWTCVFVELAADNGIISRSNKRVRPGHAVTTTEWISMLLTAYGIPKKDAASWDQDISFLWSEFHEQLSVQWQRNIFYTYITFVRWADDFMTWTWIMNLKVDYHPNQSLLKKDFFLYVVHLAIVPYQSLVMYQSNQENKRYFTAEDIWVSSTDKYVLFSKVSRSDSGKQSEGYSGTVNIDCKIPAEDVCWIITVGSTQYSSDNPGARKIKNWDYNIFFNQESPDITIVNIDKLLKFLQS